MLSQLTYKGLIIVLVAGLLLSQFSNIARAANVGVSAKAAILIEQESGRVLFGQNENEVMRIASITKIMTAILAIESGKLDETVTVSDRAFGTEGSSLFLKRGEKIKLEDLVYGLMLRSGNDAAVAIAEHVGGSLEGFIFLMNQKAAQLGMSNSTFANPHGLDDHEEHYSTAYDMAKLTRYAMNNPQYQKISGTESYRVSREGEKWDTIWKNKNRLLSGLYKYCTGGKTGYTKRAKRTLVTTAEKNDLGLVAVTLNGPDDWNDHISMYNWAFEEYDMVSIVQKGVIDGLEYEAYKGKIEAIRSFNFPLTKEEEEAVSTSITLYKPPENGKWRNEEVPSPIGSYKIKLNNEIIGSLPLYYEGTNKSGEQAGIIDVMKGVLSKFFAITLDDYHHG
jgi:D-alanyl-D-alanine carboxypeptidase (penicillin-binding protein 5/6)